MTDLRSAPGPDLPSAPDSPAVRATLREGRYLVLDGYRALAALAVLTTHVAFQTGAVVHGLAGALAGRMDLGVALFFVLSGFVLYRPYARAQLTAAPRPSLRRYLRHRALRILPAYWVLVVVVLATVDRAGHGASDWVRQLLLLQTFSPGQLQPDLTQTWSLATEVCFYLVLPVYAAAVALVPAGTLRARVRVQVVGLAMLFAIAPVWTWLVLGRPAPLLDARVAMLWLPAHLGWFAAGMLVALLREYEAVASTLRTRWWRTLAATPEACWVGAAALLLVASTPVAGPLTLDPTTAVHAATKEVLYLVIAGLLLVAGVWPVLGSVSERLFSSPPVQALGRWSYGLFLWHLLALDLVLRALHRDPFTGGFWEVLVLTALLGNAFAALSWVVVERPLQRFREPRTAVPADAGHVDGPEQGTDRE